MKEAVPVDEILALVTCAVSGRCVSAQTQFPRLLFGQRVSDALEMTLDSDDILSANPESGVNSDKNGDVLHCMQ